MYLTSTGQYAYITGLLIYEDLSLVYDSYYDLIDYKQEKEEKHEKEKLEQIRNKTTLITDPRIGTESTKDNTFTSTLLGGNKNKRESLSSVAEEDNAGSDYDRTITSPLDEIQENSQEPEDDKEMDSEEERPEINVHVPDKSESTPGGASLKKRDSLEHIKAYRNSLRKSESTHNDKLSKK